jgi:hypothetical protein
MNDLRTQRERHAALDDSVDNAEDNAADCAAAMVCTTTMVAAYPAAAASFFAVNPTDVGSPEIEGGPATYTANTTQVSYVLNVGTQVPPVGTRVVAHAVGGRWVFRFDG